MSHEENKALTEYSEDLAISVKGLKKMYRLYNKPSDRLLDAFGLKKHNYKEHYALNGVDIDIKKGETIGIIGTNGSGKSTMLKIITGVLNPTEGSVSVNGRISALLELGAGFNMEYNGLENVYLNGTMMGFSRKEIDKRLDDILAFADIGDYIYQPVKTYSSGMFVRLAFAVAINIDPEILIVDEALSVGDVFFQSKCYHKFEEFKAAGKTILFVSHDLSSIAKYCDRVVVLNKGDKLAEGGPKEMIDLYKQVLVGQFAHEKDPEYKDILEDKMSESADMLEYGSEDARITEYYVTDSKGLKTNALIKGSEFTIHMHVKFARDVKQPIFAFTIKDVKGTEITGTNTMFEKAFLDDAKAGEEFDITFTQNIDLQGGQYLLSFGVTGYKLDDFTVYHRLYDALDITVISDKNTVGFFDTNSKINITRKYNTI
ncbi:MAG: ABC transporter ATP-binding protein [Lachnospiraceae bacterium]|nr:ABC transporter ATP-binding protein [Lachnospiraceae bacterium]